MNPYVIIGSAVVGLLVGLTGAGGGALMTPMLILLFSVKPAAAISSDLVAAVVMRPVGALVHLRKGTVNLRLAGWMVLGSVPTAFLGAWLLRELGNGTDVEIALGAALLAGASAMVFRSFLDRKSGPRSGEVREITVRPVPTVLIGMTGGLIVGMTSVGSGSLMIVLLLFTYPMLPAGRLVGTDLTQAVPLTAAAALGALAFGHVEFGVTGSIIIGSVPAVLVGAFLSSRAPDRFIRPVLTFVIFASGLKYVGVGTTALGWILCLVLLGCGGYWAVRAKPWRNGAAGQDAESGGLPPHKVVCVTETWEVEPSGPLRGDIRVRGSKNAVTKHMVAAMLGEGPSTIRNTPEVGDVDITAAMLESIGYEVEHSGAEITIGRGATIQPRVPEAFTGLNRIPILTLGPLLHVAGEAFVPLVGGDAIGQRPVDFHVSALRALGAEVSVGADGITARATRLHGARIDLPYPSVGATETVLLSAVLAEGKTVLRGAATEPEIVELALFLQRMGAHIELSPDRRIVIEGVPALRGAATRLAGDRLEAFSYLVAGLITKGEVRVHGCPQDRLVTAITTLARMGARFDITDEWITAAAPGGLRPAAVHTGTHPGFMTDWQQPLLVLFTQADGMSVLHETVFENRLVYVPALQQMGCEIEVFAACLGGPACRFHDTNAVHSAVVRGGSKLRGAEVTLPDVRAGFSGVLAAAVADQPSLLWGIDHIERGYHRPFEQFTSLGLTLRRG